MQLLRGLPRQSITLQIYTIHVRVGSLRRDPMVRPMLVSQLMSLVSPRSYLHDRPKQRPSYVDAFCKRTFERIHVPCHF